MDNYTEQIVNKTVGTKEKLMFFGAIMLTVLGVVVLLFDVASGALVIAVGGYFIYVAKGFQSIEYEYVFVNSDCDIARISNQQNRKEIYSFKGGDVQKVLKYTSQEYSNELEAKGNFIIKDYTSGDESKKEDWYMFFINSNNTIVVALELQDKTKIYVETYFRNKGNITGVNTKFNN